MTRGIIGKKLGMTQIFNEKGQVVPVTVIQAGPCVVVQRKTVANDGYEAVQVGFVDAKFGKSSHASKAEKGHCEKHGVAPVRVIRELRIDPSDPLKAGDSIVAGQFAEGLTVHVTGTSKGKGFAGVMKRHNFKGGPGGHGSHFHRAPGSVGQCATPSRVFKGLKLPGHMGAETVTVRNLQIVKIDLEQNLLLVKGAVPGGKNALLTIRMA
jgi:large subunit ribosomal protein L3